MFSSSIVVAVVVVFLVAAPPWPCVCAFVVLIERRGVVVLVLMEGGHCGVGRAFCLPLGFATRVTRIAGRRSSIGFSRYPHNSNQLHHGKTKNRLLLKFFRGLHIGDDRKSMFLSIGLGWLFVEVSSI